MSHEPLTINNRLIIRLYIIGYMYSKFSSFKVSQLQSFNSSKLRILETSVRNFKLSKIKFRNCKKRHIFPILFVILDYQIYTINMLEMALYFSLFVYSTAAIRKGAKVHNLVKISKFRKRLLISRE